MQTQRIRTIRRSCREHAGQRIGSVAARVNLQRVAAALVKPGDDEHLIANRHAEQAVRRPRIDLKPNVWCALVALLRRLLPGSQRRSDEADRAQLKIGR